MAVNFNISNVAYYRLSSVIVAALGVAVIVIAIELGAGASVFRWIPESLFLTGTKDLAGYTAVVLRRQPVQSRMIAIVGGSAMSAGFLPPDEVQTQLNQMVPAPINWIQVGAVAVRPPEIYCIVEALAPPKGSIVFIQINRTRLFSNDMLFGKEIHDVAWYYRYRRFFISYEPYRILLERTNHPVPSISLLDAYRDRVAILFSAAVKRLPVMSTIKKILRLECGEQCWRDLPSTLSVPMAEMTYLGEDRKKRNTFPLRTSYDSKSEVANFNRAALVEVIQGLKERGVRTVLFNMPEHDKKPVPAAWARQYRDAIQRLEGEGAIFLDFSDDPEFSPGDFADSDHLEGTAKERWTKKFLVTAVKHLEDTP